MHSAPAKDNGGHRKNEIGSGKGHDFGSEQHLLIVGGTEFVQHLGKANIQACAYGMAHHHELDTALPAVSLVGTDSASLESVFKEFQRWAVKEGGDAAELTFVLLRGGGYALGISPHFERMYRRLSGHDRTSSPILFMPTWVKKFDSRNPMLEDLRKYKQRVISPFVLSAVLRPHGKPADQLVPGELAQIASIEGLLKFEATFVDEEDVAPHTTASVVLRTHRGKVTSSPNRDTIRRDFHSRRTIPADYFRRRNEILERHFPVTVERLRHYEAHRNRLVELREHGVRSWQQEQAVCNLILSKAVCGELHYKPVPRNDVRHRVMEGLGKMFEQANGSDEITRITMDQILEQVRLDAAALLTELGKSPQKRSLTSLQAQLRKRRLLDCKDV